MERVAAVDAEGVSSPGAARRNQFKFMNPISIIPLSFLSVIGFVRRFCFFVDVEGETGMQFV